MTEIVIDRERFAEAVKFAAKTLPRTATMPVLTGLRLTLAQGSLAVSSFDYETYSAAHLACEGPDLDYIVPGLALLQYVSGMAGELLNLDFGEHGLEVTCGRMRATLPRLPLSEYPSAPDEPPHVGNVSAEALITALDSVRECIDPNSPNAGRRGYVLLLGSPLTVAGVHPQRIAKREVEWTGNVEASAIVPVSSVDAARAFEDEVVVGYDEGRISLADADRQIITRLVAAKPDNFPVMFDLPKPVATLRFDRAEMAAALKWLVVNDNRREACGAMSFDIGTDQVTLTLVGQETGATTTVAAKVEGEQQEMGWLARNLLSGLNSTSAETVTLTVQRPLRAALLTADDDPTFAYIAQPWSLR